MGEVPSEGKISQSDHCEDGDDAHNSDFAIKCFRRGKGKSANQNKEYYTWEIPAGPTPDCVEYLMNHKKRGIALIFNHWKFQKNFSFLSSNLEERKGAEVDGPTLQTTFENLGFKVELCDNFTKKNVMEKLKEESDHHHDADCLVVVVMTHGYSDGKLYTYDGTYYKESKLWESFYGDKCPSLRGKPKLFFIQACRGKLSDEGNQLNEQNAQTDEKPLEKVVTYTLPNTADLLIAHATFDGYSAWRDPKKGSWFIQVLCAELNEHGTEYDFLRIMTAVNWRVAMIKSNSKQMSNVFSTLRKLLYFRPKSVIENL